MRENWNSPLFSVPLLYPHEFLRHSTCTCCLGFHHILVFPAQEIQGIGQHVWSTLAFIVQRYGNRRLHETILRSTTKPFSGGNYEQVFNPNAWRFHEFLAKTYGSMTRLHGPCGTNTLYTFDPKAMQTVLVKDQNVFEEEDGFIEGNLLIFGEGLFSTLGHRHHKQRKILNPAFSAAHMREMIPVFFEVAHKLESALKNRLQAGPSTQEVEILSWMGRTALELIGQAGLGYSFDPLADEDSAHPYSQISKELFPTLIRLQFWQFNILPYVSWIGTAGFRRRIIKILPWKDLHHMQDMIDYMYGVAEEIYKIKLHAFEAGDEAVALQIGRGNDLISVLMKENMKASEEDRLGDVEVIAQMNTLIFAAMDTTSSAMARILHLLSQHPETQEKLRQEIIEAKHLKDGHDFSYEDLSTLPYLDAVCRETLRLYTPVTTVTRSARQDTIIPLLKPIIGLDGTEIHEVAAPNGTRVIVSIYNSNRNPDLWGEDANEWKPERWLSPLPKALVEAHIPGVYSHLMTFLGGGTLLHWIQILTVGNESCHIHIGRKLPLLAFIQRFRNPLADEHHNSPHYWRSQSSTTSHEHQSSELMV